LPGCKRAGATVLPNAAAILSVYGLAHIVVDTISAAVVFGAAAIDLGQPEAFVGLLLLYHALAFGLQPMVGLATDAAKAPRFAAVLGCLITAAAVLLTSWPVAAIVAVGIGNAVFHVGGGTVSLRLTPGRATAPGLFVAPGSIGLLAGAILGRNGAAASLPLLPVALVLCLLMARMSVPAAEPAGSARRRVSRSASISCRDCRLSLRESSDSSMPILTSTGRSADATFAERKATFFNSQCLSRGDLVLGLVLLSIAVRGLLGFLVTFPWETQPVLLIVMTLATVLGKALGGILADRWGWTRVAVGSMLAGLPLLACASTHPVVAIPGLFLLNITMPVTLAATARSLPGHPGFAFGLTCLALILGAIAPLSGVTLNGPVFVSVAIVVSMVVLYGGLRLLSIDQSFRKTAQVQV
jgi:MFS transporter, FSR family, fosmidomycin resistance protein